MRPTCRRCSTAWESPHSQALNSECDTSKVILTNAVMLQVRGAEHVTGTDTAWTWEIPWGRGPALAFDACLLWFFDTYLKGEAPPFPTNPEIYNVQRK